MWTVCTRVTERQSAGVATGEQTQRHTWTTCARDAATHGVSMTMADFLLACGPTARSAARVQSGHRRPPWAVGTLLRSGSVAHYLLTKLLTHSVESQVIQAPIPPRGLSATRSARRRPFVASGPLPSRSWGGLTLWTADEKPGHQAGSAYAPASPKKVNQSQRNSGEGAHDMAVQRSMTGLDDLKTKRYTGRTRLRSSKPSTTH